MTWRSYQLLLLGNGKNDRSAVPVNGLYLEQLLQTNPEKLAKNTPGGPEIVGAVYIHPTAQIDPQAKVRLSAFVLPLLNVP